MAGRIIRMADLVPAPWPNGRGITRDLVRQAGPDGGLAWLATIADLVEDAPFSHLPGIDRTFTVIEGGPVELAIEGSGPILCPPFVPIAFPGDRPTGCRMPGGRARAFNLMAARGAWQVEVRVVRAAGGWAVAIPAGLALVHCVDGRCSVAGRECGPGDTFVDPPPEGIEAMRDGATAILVRISKSGG